MLLNEYQMDILKELSNIGTAHAATALSQLINEKINIDIPITRVINRDSLLKKSPQNKEYIGVEFAILGEVTGKNIFFVNTKQIGYIIEKLLHMKMEDIGEENILSTLQEIGNILSANFLTAIGEMLNLLMIPSVPMSHKGSFYKILKETISGDELIGDDVILIRTKMKNKNMTFTPFFAFAPFKKGLEIIIKKMDEI